MRHTRREVMGRARREFATLDRLVRRLRPADWTWRVPRPPTRDPWTVKDALAHIVYWKEHTARVIRGERRPPPLRGLDVNQINRVIYLRWRRRSPGQVVEWHRRVHADVLRTLARTPHEWFGRRERSPQWPADLHGHSAAHRMRDIEAALRSPGGRPAAAREWGRLNLKGRPGRSNSIRRPSAPRK
ncbi:MAG: DinB family protein [Candidatus Rokubacteria bacterium]|nr:DinB family protein [Candidatus Rokubacteria bacterium]